MKILTILIFSGDRFCVKYLLSDIVLLKKKQKNLDVAVVEWSKNKKILLKKKKIYSHYRKKIKNFNLYYDTGNWEFKYKKFINNFNSKYILLIGDDDRINVGNFIKIFKHLKLNYSGITVSFQNFRNEEEICETKNFFLSNLIRSFNIFKDFHRIGFTSCQIIKTDLINKIFNQEKNNLLTTQFPQNFIILKIIKTFDNWKVSNLNCIYNRIDSLDLFVERPKRILERLKTEYTGYFVPLINNYSHLSLDKLKKIYTTIFFKNIMSWWFLSLKYCGKNVTFLNLKSNRNIIEEPLFIKIILFFFYITPIWALILIKNLRRIFIK